ncbi:SDR family NAD(P)-dependent oxidoreductase [Planotetraspora kaengkrachanensis]|uniref:3-oxoacyl-ACP reductase n=1 Tax=Planotetraspora kaengkrachanensis TaxID=575193 RepID=A0A8J3LY29_9ACTN|nr:SDR family NAD(P)-dependent oxidoreductase [Planotetraspora kaengkrachanensis]GIG80847.1 3-oxoacyl-ACP reductase [Planotetraspora kaengkrachanensis]
MDVNLTGRRALVTGSSSGLGEAIARLLATEGADVVVHGRDVVRARTVAADIGAVAVAIGDLATDEGADAVAATAGEVDILVNNAGTYDHSGWDDATPQVWVRTYEVNVVSGVRMIRRLVPGMRERGWGRVIQIGGGLSSQPTPMLPHYSASLAARHNLAVSLARELKGTGVTSNVVSPGAILVDSVERFLTEMAPERGWGESWEEIERNAARDFVPNDFGRFGRPEEIAGAVVYLASPYADYVSGATIRVDGGTIRSVI